jgi:predicted DNA-binding transcriptional regulator AlpA
MKRTTENTASLTVGVAEIASALGYHPNWVYRRVRAGLFPVRPIELNAKKLRFLRRDVEQWLNGQRQSVA